MIPEPANEVAHGARDEHLSRDCPAGDAGLCVNGDTAELLAYALALTGVQAGANLQTELADRFADRARRPNCPRRAVERGEEAVAGRVDLPPLEMLELFPDQPMVFLDQAAPAAVAEARDHLGRMRDVGEQDSREDAIRLGNASNTGEEGFDLVEQVVCLDPGEVILTAELDIGRTANLSGDPPTLLDLDVSVAGPLEHERWHRDGRQALRACRSPCSFC